jgi:hypothetical protein
MNNEEVLANINSFFTVHANELSDRFDGEYPNHDAATALGWKCEKASNELGNDRVSYVKGTLHLWQVGQSYPSILIWWVCADLIDNRYRNHRTHATFNEAVKLEERDRAVIDLAVELSTAETYYPRRPPKHVSDWIKEWEDE